MIPSLEVLPPIFGALTLILEVLAAIFWAWVIVYGALRALLKDELVFFFFESIILVFKVLLIVPAMLLLLLLSLLLIDSEFMHFYCETIDFFPWITTLACAISLALINPKLLLLCEDPSSDSDDLYYYFFSFDDLAFSSKPLSSKPWELSRTS